MSEPYLSFVATSRNDNHGGDLTRRMQAFVSGLAAQCDRHGLRAELIMVEWNPPADRPPLRDALVWPGPESKLKARIVRVPPEVHARFEASDKLPLFQMIAKNVGLQRARGAFAVATNVDLLFSDALIAELAREKLEEGIIYRIDRHDVAAAVMDCADPRAQLEACCQSLLRVNAREGTFLVDQRGRRQPAERDVLSACARPCLCLDRGFSPTQSGLNGAPFRAIYGPARIFVDEALPALHLDLEPGPNALKPARLRLSDARGERLNRPLNGRELISIPEPQGWIELDFGPPRRSPTDMSPPILAWLHRLSKNPIPSARLPAPVGLMARLKAWISALREDPESAPEPGLPYMHTNGCGDFTLLAKADWHKLQGYPELEVFSMHLDSLLLFEAATAGLREQVFEDPMRIYHIEHGAGWTPGGDAALYGRLAERGIPSLTYKDLLAYAERMRSGPLRLNAAKGDQWGLGHAQLDEFEIN